jgi:predicted DNA-binding transcriptional regulator YafY
MDRTKRLFALVENLRARRKGVTAEVLAERFGVSVRTIYRDLDAIREGVVPVHAEAGPGGGYRIDASYTIPPLVLQPREAALLLAILRFARAARWVPFLETLEALEDKIVALLPKAVAADVDGRASELVFLGIPTLPLRPAVRKALEEAWFSKATVTVDYEAQNGERHTWEGPLLRIFSDRQAIRVCLRLADGTEKALRGDRILRLRPLRPVSEPRGAGSFPP